MTPETIRRLYAAMSPAGSSTPERVRLGRRFRNALRSHNDRSELTARYRGVVSVAEPGACMTTERHLDDLYADLAALESVPPSPAAESEIQRILARLIELEHTEADRMRAYFEEHKAFDVDAAERSLERADELIRRHAHLA